MAATQTPCTSYVGIRADEPDRAGMLFPSTSEIRLRFPLRDAGMSQGDVWRFLDQRRISIPARTDCAICYHQTLGEWWRLWKLHPDMFEEGVQLEAAISTMHGRPYTLRNASRDRWPAALADLRREFETGRVPPRTVQQIDMFRGERRTMTGACRICSM